MPTSVTPAKIHSSVSTNTRTLNPANPLADRAKTGTNIAAYNGNPDRLLGVFRRDLQAGNLPQASYISAPEAYAERPNWASNFSARYISQFLTC
jgi:phospholipase C